MPVLSTKPTRSARRVANKVFDPANETTVTYEGNPVALLRELPKIKGERHFKIRIGTIEKVVSMGELSPYAPKLRRNNNRFDLGTTRRNSPTIFY